MILPN